MNQWARGAETLRKLSRNRLSFFPRRSWFLFFATGKLDGDFSSSGFGANGKMNRAKKGGQTCRQQSLFLKICVWNVWNGQMFVWFSCNLLKLQIASKQWSPRLLQIQGPSLDPKAASYASHTPAGGNW